MGGSASPSLLPGRNSVAHHESNSSQVCLACFGLPIDAAVYLKLCVRGKQKSGLQRNKTVPFGMVFPSIIQF